MKRIDKLTFKNFKFFVDEEVFDFERKNILIYGENGSGKSSLYWGLYTFLQSSLKEDSEIEKYFDKDDEENLINQFIEEENKDDVSISLKIKDSHSTVEEFKISKDTINTNKDTNTNIKRANATSDFINYRLLSRFYDFRNSEVIDVWRLFEKEILEYITIDGDNLKDSWNILKDGLAKVDSKYPTITSQTYKDFQDNLKLFNQTINTFLISIIEKTNMLLRDNFKEKISISIEYIDSVYNDFIEGSSTKRDRLVREPEIILKVKFNDKDIKRPHTFLNEAKLTAIALSLRFAILKTRLVSDDTLKILVLDDLLISLDMSHRLEVINIILNDEDLKEYQKIILTHDRAFFEVAKEKFNFQERNEWNYFEMFVDNEGDIEKPYIKKSLDYFESAKKHFDEYDYPACANYLRKEVERIKKIVNQNDISGIPTDRSIQIIKGLITSDDFTNFSHPDTTDNTCIGRVRSSLIGIKRNLEVARQPSVEMDLQEIGGILYRILHPQSHDDTSRPLYKKELEEAIAKIEETRETILSREDS